MTNHKTLNIADDLLYNIFNGVMVVIAHRERKVA